MTPLHISDPVIPGRHKSRSTRVLSPPVIVILICAIAGVPPITSRLLALDATLHANNETIVFYMLAAAPFLMIGVAVFGLWMMFATKRQISEPQA